MTTGSRLTYEQITRVERDVCLFLRLQADLPGIDGDLDYHSVFDQPYWEFLVQDFEPYDVEFIRSGCLLLILAMAWDVIDGSGNYLLGHIRECQAAVQAFSPEDEPTAKLVRVVMEALDEAVNPKGERDELERQAVWANRTFILGYFQSAAIELEKAHARLGDDQS